MRTVLVLLFVLAGCSQAAPIPQRSSPRAVFARPFGEGSRIVDVDPDHEAWASVGGDRLELQTPDGVVLSMPWESWHAWLHVDVAPDRTAALCTEREVRVVDGGVEEIRGLEEIVTGGDFSRCAGIATRGGGDVVLLLEADPTRTFPLPPSEVPPPRLCHRASGRWRCRAIPTTPASLALTAGHVWWLASGTLFTVDTLDFESDPLVVATELGGASLSPSHGEETVLVVPWPGAADDRPRLVGLDGVLVTFETASEDDGYDDVWLSRDGRVLAIDAIRDGVSRCGPAVFSWGRSCSTEWFWTQLVVVELAEDDPPRELGHVDYEGGGEYALGVEAPGGTLVSGDAWYLLAP